MTPADAGAPWPADLVHAELRRPAGHFTVIERRINHVKVDCETNRVPRAKAYFGFLHSWFRPGLPTHEPARASLKPVPANGDLKVAIAHATAFLLEARTSEGWWRDFSGVLGTTEDWASMGWNEEWVTAFVAAALVPTGAPQAIEAARRAWTLLVERRLPIPGWGANRTAPVDADSTGYVLRLASALGMLETKPARAARRLLAGYQQSDGGLTSYLPDQCPRLRTPLLHPPNGSYDGWCRTSHACVTAGVARILGEKQRDFLRNSQRRDGSWEAYWWEDDEYPTALAAEALVAHARPGDDRRGHTAVDWARRRLSDEGSVDASPFATAWCVRLLRLRADHATTRAELERAVHWLLDHQDPDGGWRPSARLIAPRPDVTRRSAEGAPPPATSLDEGRTYTTASVLSALISSSAST